MATRRSTRKTNKNVLTVQQKIEICHKLQTGIPATDVANEYNTSVKTLRRIRKNARNLLNYANSGNRMLTRRNRRKPVYEDIENQLYLWFLERRALGDKLTDSKLQEKALKINKECGGPSKFNANRGWVTRFKERHNIRSVPEHEQIKTPNESSSVEFGLSSIDEVKKEAVEYHDTNNVDETFFTWEDDPSRTSIEVDHFQSTTKAYQLENGMRIEYKEEEIDIPIDEQDEQQLREEQQKEEQNQEVNARDTKKKELAEAFDIIEKYASNKTMLAVAQSLINDILEADN